MMNAYCGFLIRWTIVWKIISLKIELMNNLLGQPIFSAGSIEECKYNLNDIALGGVIPRDN